MLPKVLKHIHNPVLYWLDAHYSRGVTGLGLQHTPIFRELEAIKGHAHFANCVIIIDDAVSFISDENYPNVRELESIYPKNYHGCRCVIIAIQSL